MRGFGESAWPICLTLIVRENEAFCALYPSQIDTMLFIRDAVCSCWRVVATDVIVRDEVLPIDRNTYLTCSDIETPSIPAESTHLPRKSSPRERVQWLLLISKLVTSTRILLLQGAEEPFQNQQGALLGVFLSSWCNKDGRMLSPIRGEFDQ